jgi:hypothetical protein
MSAPETSPTLEAIRLEIGDRIRRAALTDAMGAVCEHCRLGRHILKGEWHELVLVNPTEVSKAYCLATPIRRML